MPTKIFKDIYEEAITAILYNNNNNTYGEIEDKTSQYNENCKENNCLI